MHIEHVELGYSIEVILTTHPLGSLVFVLPHSSHAKTSGPEN